MNTPENLSFQSKEALSAFGDPNISSSSNLSPQDSSSTFVGDIALSDGHSNDCLDDGIGHNSENIQRDGDNPDSSPRTIIDASSLNRSNFAELQHNAASLEPYTNRYLRLVEQKVQYFPQRFRDPDYIAHSSLLLTSHWVSSSRYAHCCRPNTFNPSGTCKLHQFCTYCCYLKQQRLLEEFLPQFQQASWHTITLSFEGDLLFDSSNQVEQYWKACNYGLRVLLDEGLIEGYYITKELKINHFLSTRVLPHCHAVVVAESLDQYALNRLRQVIASHPHIQLPASIKAEAIADERDLHDRLRYLYKPLNLLEAYRRDWRAVESTEGVHKWQLNSAVSDFLGRYHQITYQKVKMQYAGILHPQHNQYIGVPKHQRSDYAELIQSVRAQAVPYSQEASL